MLCISHKTCSDSMEKIIFFSVGFPRVSHKFEPYVAEWNVVQICL